MSSFQNYAVTRKSAANLNTQTHELAGLLVDDNDGHTIADYTGANAKQWPAVLNQLSATDQDEIVESLAQSVLRKLAGEV